MPPADLVTQLKKSETEFLQYKTLFASDGVVTSEEQEQLDTIEKLIRAIRAKVETGGAGITGQPDDLSAEYVAAERFAEAWGKALSEVSSQVGSIRKAMSPMRDRPNVAAIYDGLGEYDGMDNVLREFPDLDLTKLMQAAADNDRQLYETTLLQAAKEVGQARTELTELRPLLNALDNNPYGVKTNADDIVTRVLEEIAGGLGV